MKLVNTTPNERETKCQINNTSSSISTFQLCGDRGRDFVELLIALLVDDHVSHDVGQDAGLHESREDPDSLASDVDDPGGVIFEEDGDSLAQPRHARFPHGQLSTSQVD